jgi:hypothetical protein
MVRDNILFLPIDIPKLSTNLDKIKMFRKQRMSDEVFGDRFFRSVHLRGPIDSKSKSFYHIYDETLDWQWTTTATDHFQEVIEHVKLLPFKLITFVSFIGAKDNKLMPPHYDYPLHQLPDHVRRYDPYAYRVSLGDTHDAFYVSTMQGLNDDELDRGKYLFGNLPFSTNNWSMTCSKSLHGTLPREDKETLFVSGILDEVAHQQIIDRSYEKYKDYAITTNMLTDIGRPLREIIPVPWGNLRQRHPELYEI